MISLPRFRISWAGLAAVALVAAGSLRAQLTFTLTGTITTASVDLGYAVNDPVTFSITTQLGFDNFVNSNHFSFNGSTAYNWRESFSDSPPAFVYQDDLFSSFTGTGLTGSYSRMSGSSTSLQMYDDLSTRSYSISITGTGSQIGTLTGPALGANAAIDAINIYLQPSWPLPLGTPAIPTVFTDPNIAFAGLAGTSSSGGFNTSYITLRAAGGGFTTAQATISSFSVSAIPEPSTYAAVAGLATLGLAVWRRRRRDPLRDPL